jgi:hypothetical protein
MRLELKVMDQPNEKDVLIIFKIGGINKIHVYNF